MVCTDAHIVYLTECVSEDEERKVRKNCQMDNTD